MNTYQFLDNDLSAVKRSDGAIVPWNLETGGPAGGGRVWQQWVADGAPEPDAYSAPGLSEADIRTYALTLKIAAINALAINDKSYDATDAGLASAKSDYRDCIDAYNLALAMSETPSEESTATLGLIKQAYAYFASVEEAVTNIIDAGDAVDPINEDDRWPD
ncbi:hypothetical protein [uncultured Cohaesibacter sp.]|uniref:hypothetical protein n=1 Tax=uncultured Cohaesibacter sp. TaxID=1002546 RepID=UPI00292F6BF4|nr:hypothetical protein [uncultured Cohaesibacter sp.]